jgi:fibronectin type 3 domain-containing protein
MIDTVTRRAVLRRVCGGASVEISGQYLAEKIMNFEFLPGSRRHRRPNKSLQAPAMLESLEARVVLSAAPVVSLPGVPVGSGGVYETSDSTPLIAFTAVEGATGYEIYVSDVEARERILLDSTIASTAREYTPTTEFQLGANRIWMRALFGSGAPGPYSAPVNVLLKTVPAVTGPLSSVAGVPRKVDGNQFPITWTDSKGARSYEIFLSNQTTQTSTVYRVQNRTPVLDALGQAIPDGKGGVLLQETRQFFTSGAVTLPPQVPRPISGASNTTDIEIMLNNHGLKTGEQVRINGVEGNTAANGTFFVTVTGDNTFLLRGVRGTGNWTGGGNLVQVTQLRSELEMGSYRVFMRSVDDSVPGRTSEWSPAYAFEVAPAVKLLRPVGQSFDTPITVEWEGVADATHYELIVKPRGAADSAAVVNVPYLKATSYQLPTSQLSTIAFNGSPTGGSYRLSFRYPGENGRTDTTALLPFNATATDIRAAVSRLGFQNVSVRTTTTGANPVHELTLGRVPGPIGVSAVSLLTPGSVSVTTQQIATDYGDMEYRVRARRLTQVSDVTISGTPETGSFRLSFATPGPKGTTVTTAPLPFSASAAEVQTQIRLLEGYSRAVVSSRGTAPNVTYSIVLPQLNGQITVSALSEVTPGTVQNSGNRYSPEVTGISSPTAFFSTNPRPVVTPLPGAQIYTDEKPTLRWSAVDRAATYRIWVDRNAAKTIYLQTESPSNSFTFAEKLPAGNYFFWVQSVSNTGELSKWSEPYQFTATGGAPVILTPANNSSTINPLPRVTWTPVAEAVTYNIQVALIGGRFDFITVSGLTTNRFTPANPLNAGTYRVWIQAVTSDGRKLPWSAPSTFRVV